MSSSACSAIASSFMPATRARRLDLAALFASLARGTIALFCGPMRMLEAARGAWAATGRPLRRFLLRDLRLQRPLRRRSRSASASRETGAEFTIPADRSMLDVLNAAGHDVISDCRRGECGVCAVDVVEVDGQIDHRDVFFSDAPESDNHKICPCVSRARGTITVDTLYRSDSR